jgi:hypothetical protein
LVTWAYNWLLGQVIAAKLTRFQFLDERIIAEGIHRANGAEFLVSCRVTS